VSDTWKQADLAAVLAGELDEPAPALLALTDGRHLLYRAAIHSLAGPPESLKGWLVLLAAVEVLRRGKVVVYIDFEGTARRIVGRLKVLGLNDEQILAGLHYFQPEPYDKGIRLELEAMVRQYQPELSVLDGVTMAGSLAGLNLNDNSDAAKWSAWVPRALVSAGGAVVLIDHPTKAGGRGSLGATEKLADVDVALKMQIARAPGRGKPGMARIFLEKDRLGHLRGEARSDGLLAELHLQPGEAGEVIARLLPAIRGAEGSVRENDIKARVLQALQDGRPAKVKGILEQVPARRAVVLAVLRGMVSDALVLRGPHGYQVSPQSRAVPGSGPIEGGREPVQGTTTPDELTSTGNQREPVGNREPHKKVEGSSVKKERAQPNLAPELAASAIRPPLPDHRCPNCRNPISSPEEADGRRFCNQCNRPVLPQVALRVAS
jgi:hypothetical protein